MPESQEIEALEAKHGEKMIELRIRFWTNDMAPNEGEIIARHAWTSGVVRMQPNQSHGIDAKNPVPFNSLLDLSAKIEEVLISNGIMLHLSRGQRKYTTG